MRALDLLRVLAGPLGRRHGARVSAKDFARGAASRSERLNVERSARLRALKRRIADAWSHGRVGVGEMWAREANAVTRKRARNAGAQSLVAWWGENVSRRRLPRHAAPPRLLRASRRVRAQTAGRRVRTRAARVGGRPVPRRVQSDGGGSDGAGDGPGDGPVPRAFSSDCSVGRGDA